MPNFSVDLSLFANPQFCRGASIIKETIWLCVSLVVFRLCPFSLSSLKRAILRAFGASIGKGVIIKPQVKITFPWKLSIGDNVWIGEEAWLLNLDKITIGNNVCISQRAFLCTGNHDYGRRSFNLITKPITIEDGAWVGAACWVGPGVNVGTHAVLAAYSVAKSYLEPFCIYQGNPAKFVKKRVLR